MFDLASSNFKGIICEVLKILKLVFPILIALAILFFLWGVTKFVIRAPSEKDLVVGRRYMLWSVIALFVLFSFGAIVGIITNEFEFGKANSIPFLPGSGGNVCSDLSVPSVTSGITDFQEYNPQQ
jgi:hypothetical protein